MSTSRRKRVILGLLRKNFPHLLKRAKAIYNALLANPGLFASPNPPLAAILKKIQAFDDAQQLAGTKAAGAAGARNDLAAELVTCLESVRTYVQELADANPEQAETLITAAAMMIGVVKPYNKPLLQARQDKPSAVVRLIANVALLTVDAVGKVFFNWQVSSDGGKTWGNLPSTPHGHTDVTGLAAMTTYCFRVSITHGVATDAWSDDVTLLVR